MFNETHSGGDRALILAYNEGMARPSLSNKERVQSFHKEILEGGDLTRVPNYVHPKVVLHSAYLSEPAQGVDQLMEFLGGIFASVTNPQVATEDIIAEGDKVTVRWTFSGIDSGDFMNIPATGRPMKVHIASIYRLEKGKIEEIWAFDTGIWGRVEF